MRKFRKGAIYAPDSVCFEKIDRNERVRVIYASERLERRTKEKGKQSGAIGQAGLRVLRCLLMDFCNVPTGRCCPGYAAIRRMTGFCFSTISAALQRLEETGLIRITRRLIRTPAGVRQATNAYAFKAPSPPLPDYETPRGTSSQGFIPFEKLGGALHDALESLGRRMRFAT